MNKDLKTKPSRKKMYLVIGIILAVAGSVAGLVFWKIISSRVYIEKAEINAPTISLSASESGTLNEVMVHEGDTVTEDEVVAKVGDELIKSQTPGLVIKVNSNLGKIVGTNESIVTMINPDDLRVVGHLDENKGLTDIRVGQRVVFTADAFGSKQYAGIVDEVSGSSRDSDVVFSISDKREAKKYDIKIRFSQAAYPELKNGMSSEVWVYKN